MMLLVPGLLTRFAISINKKIQDERGGKNAAGAVRMHTRVQEILIMTG